MTPFRSRSRSEVRSSAAHGRGATTFEAREDNDLVIARHVNAPYELVFPAWTDVAYLPHWLGRRDWIMTVCQSEPRPGGIRRFLWRRTDGAEMGVRGVYREVSPPLSFVCTERFDGAPGETLNMLRFVEHDGQTTMISTIRYPSAQARDAALATEMRAGLDESLTRLAERLSLAQTAARPAPFETIGREYPSLRRIPAGPDVSQFRPRPPLTRPQSDLSPR